MANELSGFFFVCESLGLNHASKRMFMGKNYAKNISKKVRVTSVQETIRKEDAKEMFEYL